MTKEEREALGRVIATAVFLLTTRIDLAAHSVGAIGGASESVKKAHRGAGEEFVEAMDAFTQG